MPKFAMSGLVDVRNHLIDSEILLDFPLQNNFASSFKASTRFDLQIHDELCCPIIPGLPDDIAKLCLVLVPCCYYPSIGSVCKKWRSFIQSKEFLVVRKEVGLLEEWVYILIGDSKDRGSYWEVLCGSSEESHVLPTMPGPAKAGFGVAVLDAKLIIMAGYEVDVGTESVSNDVYQYDSRLNRWSMLAQMNVARHDFACSEVGGLIYVVGGFDTHGCSLSSVEVYDPEKNAWTVIESLRRPRWGCFACSFSDQLYVMGGRSSFTIGNSRFVDVYNPENHSWSEMKNGCVMVTAHAVLNNKLFCMEWKNERKLAIYNPVDNSWVKVPVPVNGSSNVGFRFGIFDGKLLLFSVDKVRGYQTLLYDPDARPGLEWKTSSFEPSGSCLHSVTIKI